MYLQSVALGVLASTTVPAVPQSSSSASASVWNVKNFRNLITFGDSYTDENRLNYVFAKNGTYPPPGTFLPESFKTASGGKTWPRVVVQYTGSTTNGQWNPQLELYDYAVSGAACSNLIRPQTISASLPNVLFPSVLEYEVPIYTADLHSTRNGTNNPYFTTPPTNTNSIYTLWIGTNDLGESGFLTDSQVPGKTLTDYTSCIYSVFDALYSTGARVFVLMNNIPLELTPLYANATLNGTTAQTSQYWPNKPANATGSAEKIREYSGTVNDVFKYQTAFETLAGKRYPDAHFALFDVHTLFEDMYRDPSAYFNGSQPVSVTSYENRCVDGKDCVLAFGGMSPDSFMWYDTLHPSQQSDRVIARNFVEVINGTSKYAKYY